MKTNLKNALTKGFSLIELLVVIAVIGVIAAVAIPSISGVAGAAKSNKDTWNTNEASRMDAAKAVVDEVSADASSGLGSVTVSK